MYEHYYDLWDFNFMPFVSLIFLFLAFIIIVAAIVTVIYIVTHKKEGDPMNRNIALSIVLSVVTCGIYSIYWFVVLTDEVNRERAEYQNEMSGVICFLLTLVTCNIYGIYWAFKMGEKLDTIKHERGIPGGNDSNVLYLILEIFGLNVVVLALAQNELNKFHPPAAPEMN